MNLMLTFLRDRLHWVALAYLNTLLVLLVGALLLEVRGAEPGLFRQEAGYLLLLTTFMLMLFLAYDLVRWRRAEAAQALHMQKLFAAERARYEEAHRRHRSFIHLWVHQMKTPVSLVSLIAQREGLAAVEEQAGKLSEGLDLVLHMARLEQFSNDYQVRRVDLAQLVREVVGARKKQFIRLEIFPRLTVEAEESTVLSDAKWLAFAIDQVVGNALKYGGQSLRLTIRREGKALELAIADQGPGIPPEDLPRVFEPFFTGENGRRFAGATGVGLYLVKRVLDELGHGVSISSQPGAGTTVLFRFVTEL